MSATDAAAEAIRHGEAQILATALQAARTDTLRNFAAVRRAPPGLQVPQRPTLNPPLWELGHIGWFQSWWLARNPHHALGTAADPDAPRSDSRCANADAFYDSSRVPHASRWSLPLPDAEATLDGLAQQLETTLQMLHNRAGDRALYFHRLALLHEDMHHEAAMYMAQALAIDLDDPRWQPRSLRQPRRALELPAAHVTLGRAADVDDAAGFAFDNECGHETSELAATSIDSRVIAWGEFLPFVESGGYGSDRWWSAAGRVWLAQADVAAPCALRHQHRRWQRRLGAQWQPLDEDEAACHLTLHEAEAWCAWAGRRLPSEAEWQHAATLHGAAFDWGHVWEWTASRFRPFEGFTAHPYRDYSAPWFDGRPVLRGASFATQPRLRHRLYRNFFEAGRNDVPAGFRTCAP